MTISQKSLKKEIFGAYLESQTEIQILKKEIEILETAQTSRILKIDDYGQDFVNRCEVHGKEFKLFLDDLKTAAEFFTNKIAQARRVELPAFLKN